MNELRIPMVKQPVVSVVIVTYHAADVLREAVGALLAHTDPCYELIVVDNGSPDDTREVLAGEVANAKIVVNERNQGFGRAGNQGAAHAVARYVLFLNQDAFVQPGWLPPLLERVESDASIAAVGPMLLNPDGSLQCAGALLARSGSTTCYGSDGDPTRDEFRDARIVDYLSGACLLVRRCAFNAVGGFDPKYGLAYFEDADLCLSLAALGYRSIYEPRATVTHVRGRATTDEAFALLALRNRALFERRWRSVLARRPLAPLSAHPHRVLAARDAPARSAVG